MNCDFKALIVGWQRKGKTCPCCREVASKVTSRRLARRRLAQKDRKILLADDVAATDE